MKSLLLLLVALTAAAGELHTMPAAQSGIIDGKPAMLVWPAALLENGYHGPLLSPESCEVHLSLFDDLETETRYPCGTWFVPNPDRYWVWLEQRDTVSAIQVQLLWTGIGAVGSRGIYSMVPAGYVSTALPLGDDRAARFINLRVEYRGFQRSARGSVASTRMRIPTGRIAGGIFDRKSGDAIALFRPFDLAAGQRISVAAAAQTGAAVFAVMKSPQVHRKRIDLALLVNGHSVPANDIVDGGIRTYAFWYSLHGSKAKLQVINDAVTYDGPDLVLRPGTVSTLRAEMKLKSNP